MVSNVTFLKFTFKQIKTFMLLLISLLLSLQLSAQLNYNKEVYPLIKEQKYDEVLPLLEQFLKENPKHSNANYWCAKILEINGVRDLNVSMLERSQLYYKICLEVTGELDMTVATAKRYPDIAGIEAAERYTNFRLFVIEKISRMPEVMYQVEQQVFKQPATSKPEVVEAAIENRTIETVTIDGMDYMTTNLIQNTFRNGEKIKIATSNQEWVDACNEQQPVCCYYKFDEANANRGLLFNYYAFIDQRNIAPEGFRVPTEDDMFPENLPILAHGGAYAAEVNAFYGGDEHTLFWSLCTVSDIEMNQWCYWKVLPSDAPVTFDEFHVSQGMYVRCIKE